MKRIVATCFLSLIFLSSNIFAESDDCKFTPVGPACSNRVDISIYNNSPYNCDLSSQTIIHGDMLTGNHVPAYLAPGSHNLFNMVETSKKGASILLTYTCEEHRDITFLVRSNMQKSRPQGAVQHSQDMQGFVKTSYAWNWADGHYIGTMDWILESTHK